MNAATWMPIARITDAHLAHKVIRASAGSGKTHALSGRYLSLLAAGEEPGRILATTFTRAAAGEIRDRLLQRLAKATTDDSKRRELADSLGVRSVKPADAMAMLTRVARNLHLLQIRTLDSLFASVVRAYAIELGLPAECAVIDESADRMLRHEAIAHMLDERDPQTLIDLLRLLTRGDSDRGVTDAIDAVTTNLYELWRESGLQAWDWIQPREGLLSHADLIDAIDALADAPVPADKRFAGAKAKNIEALMRRNWNAFLGSGLAKPIVRGETTYYKKPIDDDLLNAYEPLVNHAAAELVHRLREQTLATRALLQAFHEQYDHQKRAQRVLSFNDLTQAMIQARAGSRDGLGTMDDLAFRLDATIHHLLLDEFQDTSGSQWQALCGIAVEIASQLPPERTFFCVGDVKQSIYGWRGASPEILDRLPAILPSVTAEPLDISYRSSKVVIDAVNSVFGEIASNAAILGDAAHEQAATAWQAGFGQHDVTERLRDAPGYVQLRTIAPEAGDKAADRRRRRLALAARIAADLFRRDQNLRIALLTRTNASVARLLCELGPTGCRVPACGRGGGPLIDAPPVNAILDLLHLADHPDDTTAAFNIAMSPLGSAIQFIAYADRFARWRLARQVRQRLLIDGYQCAIAAWVALIARACDARELRRLTQLVELAGVHDGAAGGGGGARARAGSAGLRTASFIDLIENKEVPDVQPSPIEVMTVHQAKGLEFDAVILADLGGRLRGTREPMVVFERDEAGAITRIARYANQQTQDLLPGLGDLVLQTRTRAVRESLSVLYVAMTRARHGLYALIDPPVEREKSMPRTHEGVLRGALSPDRCEPGAMLHESGEPQWIERTAAHRASTVVVKHAPSDGPGSMIFAPQPDGADASGAAPAASAARERALARLKASEMRERLRITKSEGRERGSVMHALFEQIEWLEEFAADEKALLGVAKAVAPRRDELWHRRQVAAFRGMLAKPDLAAALTRGNMKPAMLRLHRELPFARLTDAGVQTGAIDRLVLKLDERNHLTSGTVIDFKTDAMTEASPRVQAESHRAQLEDYRDAVAEMFGIAPAAIEMQVLLVGIGAAVRL